MQRIIHLKSVTEINRFVQVKTKHPLVSVIDFSQADEYLEQQTRISADFYTLMLKNYCANHLKYGRQSLDFGEGSLICIAPHQVVELDTEVEPREDRMGWGLFFHPDLLRGTSLGQRMHTYSFFSYDIKEALHLSEKERDILFDCVQKIEQELSENMDAHSQTLLVSTIELLLNYCARYYGRQFITRKTTHSSVVARVGQILQAYFKSEALSQSGLPSVQDLADQVHLSPGYLSDLLKKETGMHAQDHIHYHLIEEAKQVLLNSDQTVNEIAYALGFEYPPYFSRLFKQKTGKTPSAFRQSN